MKRVALGEVAAINPSTKIPATISPDTLCPFVPMDAVDEWTAKIVATPKRPRREIEKGYTLFAKGDLLLAKITPCMENGKCAIASNIDADAGAGSTEFHVVRAGPKVLPEWIFYFWRQPGILRLAEANMTGSAGQKRVPTAFLETLEIPLPDLPTQQRIAALLTRADRLRRLRRHALEMCEEVLSSLFRHEFSEASLAGKSLVRGSLSEFADVQGGIQLSASRNAYPLQRPYLRVANVQRASLALDEIKMIGLTPQEFIRTKLEKNDILLVEGNGNPAEVGRAARWNDEVPDCVHQNHLIRVRANPKFLNPIFLLHLLNSETCREYFLREGNTTSGLVTISTGLVNDLPAIVPPLPLQQKFATLATRHDRLRRQHAESLRQAEHLFQTLLHQAFQPVA